MAWCEFVHRATAQLKVFAVPTPHACDLTRRGAAGTRSPHKLPSAWQCMQVIARSPLIAVVTPIYSLSACEGRSCPRRPMPSPTLFDSLPAREAEGKIMAKLDRNALIDRSATRMLT